MKLYFIDFLKVFLGSSMDSSPVWNAIVLMRFAWVHPSSDVLMCMFLFELFAKHSLSFICRELHWICLFDWLTCNFCDWQGQCKIVLTRADINFITGHKIEKLVVYCCGFEKWWKLLFLPLFLSLLFRFSRCQMLSDRVKRTPLFWSQRGDDFQTILRLLFARFQ